MADIRNRAAGEERHPSEAPWSRDELPDLGSPPISAISLALRDIDSHSRDFERRLGATLTVNPTDLAAMQHLIQNGPLTPSDLAARLGITTAASTLVVDRLVALGHAERQPHAHDRRKIVVVPTRSSVTRAVDELMPVIEGIAALVDDLTPDQRTTIEHFLHSVAEVYRAAADRTDDPGR